MRAVRQWIRSSSQVGGDIWRSDAALCRRQNVQAYFSEVCRLATARSGPGSLMAWGLLSLGFSILIVGCDQLPPSPLAESTVHRTGATPAGPAEQKVSVLEHDFGIVRPGSSHAHIFSIENDSSFAWTIRQIHVNCQCTSPRQSANAIAPSTRETIELLYLAAQDNSDDRRSVLVEFQEPVAPQIQLAVTAQIRDPLTVEPESLHFAGVKSGSRRQANFEILNLGAADWKALSVEPNVDWLSVASNEVEPTSNEDEAAARQIWKVEVQLDASALGPGRHRGGLRLLAQGVESVQRTFPVTVAIATPEAAHSPRQDTAQLAR